MRCFGLCLVVVLGCKVFAFDEYFRPDSPTTNPFINAHYEIPYYFGYALIGYTLFNGIAAQDDPTKSRFHKATSKSLEALVLNNLTVATIKLITGRKRPRKTTDAHEWLAFGNKSFPSGHVSSMAAMVVPYMMEYGRDHFGVYALGLLPLHQMVGRVSVQAHWVSDVIVGALIGTAIGYGVSDRSYNVLLRWNDQESFIGIRGRF